MSFTSGSGADSNIFLNVMYRQKGADVEPNIKDFIWYVTS